MVKAQKDSFLQFCDESNARKAVDDLNNRWFDGRPIHCEFSPVQDFKAACCRQYDHGLVFFKF